MDGGSMPVALALPEYTTSCGADQLRLHAGHALADTRVPVTDALGGAEAVGAGAMGVGAATGAEAKKLSTSLEVIIPSMPLPAFMENKSILFSAASFFAAGLAKGRSPLA